jgi:hypothetical protein
MDLVVRVRHKGGTVNNNNDLRGYPAQGREQSWRARAGFRSKNAGNRGCLC